MKKTLTMILAFALVFALGVGGTLAWLTDETTAVTNTFTVGDINITLEETTGENYDFVPGDVITKDPVVTVEKESEKCYLFVAITVDNNSSGTVDPVLTWEIADGWIPYGDVVDAPKDGTYYYYQLVNANETEDQEFAVLKDNTVTVSSDVTKAMVDEDLEENEPTITIDAAAVQYKNIEDEADAFNEIDWN